MSIAIDEALRKRLGGSFKPLNTMGAKWAFPPPLSLSQALDPFALKKGANTVNVKPVVATMFVTASVEVWLRSVHSFLISASLTEASPIWASVCGYYSSHYSVRALAHLLGYFQLYRRKRIVRLQLAGGRPVCFVDPKHGSDREHRFYWKVVKRDPHFATDPLFTENDEEPDESDSGHRSRANYADHIAQLPKFVALSEEALKKRIHTISKIQFLTPPIPRKSRCPDVESVQVIAYHRIVRYRSFLDEALGGDYRFWNVNRTPKWTSGLMNFQLIEQGDLGSLRN